MKATFHLKYDSHWGERLFLVGNVDALGRWDPEEALQMCYIDNGYWSVEVELSGTEAIEYKYIVQEDGQIRWETRSNRSWNGAKSVWDVFDAKTIEKKIGVAVPLFSLRGDGDFGIGEYLDLVKLADWCQINGIKIIQLLPVNDTTAHFDWHDSYPYNGISAFALNPIYLNLQHLGVDENKDFEKKQGQLNVLSYVDYPKVLKIKWKYFETAFEQQWESTQGCAAFKLFFNENRDWLEPYARFCARRDANNTSDVDRWSEHAGESCPEFYYFLQYHCDKQLHEAVNYLHSKGIMLKGDLPIGVNPNGVDVYCHPELFNCNAQAGAPPDDFAEDGQNWGFPTYNWDVMAHDDYAWWRRRLQVMARYFDAFRIDHILGFFRIWEIPKGIKSGLLGHFNPALPLSKDEIEASGFRFDEKAHVADGVETLFVRDPYQNDRFHPRIVLQKTELYKTLDDEQQKAIDKLYDDFFYHRHTEFWKQKALEKLPALIGATDMIACGEDLGMIPATVPVVMHQLGIKSLEVERMPKVFGRTKVQIEDLPMNCVFTTGTHDMPTLRAWLMENGEAVTSSAIQEIIESILDSPACWNIFPLQDLLDMDDNYWSDDPKDDQVNVPADSENHWKYRMRTRIEELRRLPWCVRKILRLHNTRQ